MYTFKGKSKRDAAAGITFSDDGIALAIVKRGPLSLILDACQFVPCLPKDQKSQLAQLVKQYQLDLIPCNCVLLPREFELIQVDAPEVTSQELSIALRWQIKDLNDFHIDDAVIDHIALPIKATSGNKPLLVVASRESVIRGHIEHMQSASCNINSVDITRSRPQYSQHTNTH